jgi:uncharacterized lipoprotein YmbA
MSMAGRITLALCVTCTALGCSSPPVRFYALSVTGTTTQAPLDVSVAVGPVTIPAAVDGSRIVLRVGPNELRPDEYNRWAAPLQDDILRTVAADLAMQLGTGRVSLSTNTSGSAPEYRASIEVERFESVLGQTATVEAEWTVRRSSDGAVQSGRIVAHEPVSGSGFGALAAAHSRAVQRLSGEIAAAVRALQGAGS